MKPRIFIGSSLESLSIAYAIQQNLEYDVIATIWSQGVFQLSNNTLEDLINSLDKFDYGIFVFAPDDILQIRNTKMQSVRDNVIFEMGLFMGKLGRDKVFYVIPRNSETLHLPTDLLGIMSGQYDDMRADNNLQAALGPFCSQVRNKVKDFVYVSLHDLQDESQNVKRLAVEKPNHWEYLLICELLDPKLKKIEDAYAELEKGLTFQSTNKYTSEPEISKWFTECLHDLKKLVAVYTIILNEEIQFALKEPGTPGDVAEIKRVCDKIVSVGKELLNWEYKVCTAILPDELKDVVLLMAGWSKPLFNSIIKLPLETRRIIKELNEGKNEIDGIYFKLDSPTNSDKILSLFEKHLYKKQLM